MRPWYCAQIYPGQEITARDHLAQQGVLSFLPTYLFKRKDRHFVVRRLFSNYLFVSLDRPSDWPLVHRSYGVQQMITFQPKDEDAYREPAPIASEAIEQLRALALSYDEIRRGGQRKLATQYITAGCFVKVNAGPFKDEQFAQRALVEWADADRAELVISLFKREIRVQFYHRDLILLPRDAPA